MVLSVPVPSSRVNCNSFFDFGTATHSLTFTARKSDLLNVSKSTNSSNKGSTFTLEKSIFSDSVFTFFSGASEAVLFTSFFLFTPSKDFSVGTTAHYTVVTLHHPAVPTCYQASHLPLHCTVLHHTLEYLWHRCGTQHFFVVLGSPSRTLPK